MSDDDDQAAPAIGPPHGLGREEQLVMLLHLVAQSTVPSDEACPTALLSGFRRSRRRKVGVRLGTLSVRLERDTCCRCRSLQGENGTV